MDALTAEISEFESTGVTVAREAEWHYQRQLLVQEYRHDERLRSVPSLLHELAALDAKHERAVRACREKDDHRGRRIMPGYDDVHRAAADDPVVREVARVAEERAQLASAFM